MDNIYNFFTRKILRNFYKLLFWSYKGLKSLGKIIFNMLRSVVYHIILWVFTIFIFISLLSTSILSSQFGIFSFVLVFILGWVTLATVGYVLMIDILDDISIFHKEPVWVIFLINKIKKVHTDAIRSDSEKEKIKKKLIKNKKLEYNKFNKVDILDIDG